MPPRPPRALLPAGTVFAGHRVVRHLGSGRVADVYAVVTPASETRALKICPLPPAPVASSKPAARTLQEAEALALIVHPNVVRLYDAGRTGEAVWLLLELVEAVSLAERLAAQPRPGIEDILLWIQQAAEGLCEAHRVAIVHRDITPRNILVTTSGSVKVIDFGAVKLRWGVQTTSEQALGSALYMSPELARGEAAAAGMDVYSLGLVLYEALAGAHPMGPAPANVATAVDWQVRGATPPLAEVAPHVPPELAALVHAAIEKDPARRLKSMRAFVEGLREVQARLRAPVRRSARNVPIGERAAVLAPTVPVPVQREPTEAPPPAPVRERLAIMPSPVSPVADTLISAVAPPPPAPAGGERRSTGVPVERAVERPSAAPSRRGALLAVIGATALAATAALGWWSSRGGTAPAPAAPAASAPAPVEPPPRATSAAPSASSSAKAPPASAPTAKAARVPPRRAPGQPAPGKNRLFDTER